MTSGLQLWDGFFGAIAGGAIAAGIALWTTRAAIRTEQEARDRDRILQAALRFRQFVTELGAASRAAYGAGEISFDVVTANQLQASWYLALKSAQFARHGDADFKAWLGWLHRQLQEQVQEGYLTKVQTGWLGNQAETLEERLFEGKALKYETRPAEPRG